MWYRDVHHVKPLRSCAVLIGFCCAVFHAIGQLDLSTKLVLDGPHPSDRQVTGLFIPLAPDDAISLDAARTQVARMTATSGSSALLGSLSPAPASYTPGMVVLIIPGSPNAAGATLELNDLGPRPLVRPGGIALAAGDLQPGVPSRFIYDGARFQLISSTQLPCPAGYSAAGRSFCIADSSQDAATFFNAASTCASQGTRLCTLGEWTHACFNLAGFMPTVAEPEWTDHAANGTNGAKLVGVGVDGEGVPGSGCTFGGQAPSSLSYRFRCCSSR